MRKHIPHPISQSRSPFAQLHIIYGGNEQQTIEESLALARDLRNAVLDDEQILYVNLLVSAAMLEHAKGKRFDHGARRNRNDFVTYSHRDLMLKLDFLTQTIKDREASYVVLNGFELAALNPRHRIEFMGWIKELRNSNVNVVVFTVNCPGYFGSLGSLRFMASTVEEVGAYLEKDVKREKSNVIGSTASEAIANTEQKSGDDADTLTQSSDEEDEQILTEEAEQAPLNVGMSASKIAASKIGLTPEDLMRRDPNFAEFFAELDGLYEDHTEPDDTEADDTEADDTEDDHAEAEHCDSESLEINDLALENV